MVRHTMFRHMPKMVVLIASVFLSPIAHGKTSTTLTVAVGTPGSDSFAFGTELWAMTQIALTPGHGISFEAREVTDDTERLALLRAGQVDAALIDQGVPIPDAHSMRAIMALWPEGHASSEMDSVQLLVRRDIPDETIYLITKTIFDQAQFFKNAHATLGIGQPEHAMTGLDVPIHSGAYRYYDEEGHGFDDTVIAEVDNQPTEIAAAESDRRSKQENPVRPAQTATYNNFDDTALNDEERSQIAAACRQALNLGSLSPVLGDLSSTGCEIFHDHFANVEGDTDAAIQPNHGRQAAERNGNQAQPLATTVDDRQQAMQRSVAVDDGDIYQLPSGQGGPAIVVETTETEEGTEAAAPLANGRSKHQGIVQQPTM